MPTVEERIKQNEGFSKYPYPDSKGKLTIGYGRNLDDNGISEEEAETFLQHDIGTATWELISRFPVVQSLDPARRDVLIEMCFNLGITRLAKFVEMWAAIEAKDFQTASDEMLDSVWATQVGDRAKRLATVMRTGVE